VARDPSKTCESCYIYSVEDADMPTLFQSIQGFAGAAGVGVLCLLGLFLIVSVFANNLPAVATLLLGSNNWTAIATIPILVVAYVVGLLAIALVDRGNRLQPSHIGALSEAPIAARYAQLEQEAEILSGSVVGFVLLGVAALLNAVAFPGWARTLAFASASAGAIAVSAWRMSRAKREKAAAFVAAAIDARSAPRDVEIQ
jgi:hypothetical protein